MELYLLITILCAFTYGTAYLYDNDVSFINFLKGIGLMFIFPIHATYKAWTDER